MKNLYEFLSDRNYQQLVAEEFIHISAEETIQLNESFKSSILQKLAKAISDAEAKHRENDNAQVQRWKENGYSGTPNKTARSFASILGPVLSSKPYSNEKIRMRGIKWDKITDEDFQEVNIEDKSFKKLVKDVYSHNKQADLIIFSDDKIVNFVKGFIGPKENAVLYYFAEPDKGWKTGVQAKEKAKYSYSTRDYKWNETYDFIIENKDIFKVYVLEIKDSMIHEYDSLVADRSEAKKGVIEYDKNSLAQLLKQQKSRYNSLVKEMKAKRLEANKEGLFDEIKKLNDDAVELYKKVMSKPEYIDKFSDLGRLMQYISYAYEQFFKSAKDNRDSERRKERAKQRAKERGEEFDENDWGKFDYDKSSAKAAIRDAEEYFKRAQEEMKRINDAIDGKDED